MKFLLGIFSLIKSLFDYARDRALINAARSEGKIAVLEAQQKAYHEMRNAGYPDTPERLDDTLRRGKL